MRTLNPWSYSYIRKLADEATLLARQSNLRPTLASEAVMNWKRNKRFNIPFLGDYIPEGWEEDVTGNLVYVDRTGSAKPGETVITQFEFFRRAEELASGDEVYGFGVIEHNQTQALIGTFRKVT